MDQKAVEKYFSLLMTEGLGLDLSDPNLCGTPARVAKMYCKEFFVNSQEPFDGFTLFPNTKQYNEIVMLDNVKFVSVCAHHFLPFVGVAWFLYIPDQTLTGASKIARLINHYSAKPQIQELLCKEVLDRFVEVLRPKGAMVVMRAIHQCMVCRGIKQDSKAGMITSQLYGVFEEDAKTRAEGFSLIELSR